MISSARVAGLARADLEREYAAYRARQARALVALMPNEAVRPLYRRALQELDVTPDADDPMALLVTFCESILPLPPFDVWLRDVAGAPEAHDDDVDASADVPTPKRPATLAVRRFHRDTAAWSARLRGFRDRDAWRGFIAFAPEDDAGRVYRTALIFRESALGDLRARFNGFETDALEAFLRSALP